MKHLLFLAWAFLLSMQIQAQTDTTAYPAPYEPDFLVNLGDTCGLPLLKLAPVIHYNQGTVAYLEFTQGPGQIRIMEIEGTGNMTVGVEGSSTLVQGLLPDKKYEVFTRNRCGVYESAGKIDTKSGLKDNLEVSSALYDAIRDYQYQGEEGDGGVVVPLTQYLYTRPDVAFFEKVYFIQQYFMKGAKISTFSTTVFPDFRPPTDCNCTFVFNLSQIAVPGGLNSGTIDSDMKLQPKQPMNGNSHTASWWNRNTKGAAKWHCLWTEGSKAGGADEKAEFKMADSTATVGTQYGQLRYNLLCTNYEQLPSNCQCDKALYLYWRYDSQVCAHAERHSEGLGGKNAVSAGEDLAIAVLRRDGTNLPVVIDGGVVRAKAECDRTVNAQFWVNAATAALNITSLILGFTGDNNSNQTQQQIFNASLQGLTSSITNLINTPYYSSNFCNSDNCKEVTPCFGDTLVYMQPNQPINLYLFSNSSLMAGGKRSWFSWSRILSDFYLAGYVPGGYRNDEEMYCCTKKYGNWVLASELGAPHSTAELKTEVGNIFSAWAPWPLPTDPFSGVIQIPYEYYSMSLSVVECAGGGTIHPGGTRSISNGETNTNSTLPSAYTIYIFDISGRLIYENTEDSLPVNFYSYLKNKLPAANSGVYIVHAVSAEDKKAYKVFLD